MAQARALSAAERRDWVRLSRSEGVGPVTFFGLLARFGTAGAALEALPGLLANAGRKATRVATVASVEAEIEATLTLGGQIIAACEPSFPKALAAVTPPPPVIAVHGDSALLHRPCVGIVGARNASAAGLRLAREMAAGLAEGGYTVVSGLARGIDGAAHAASLAKGTAAVLAGGVDHIYPPEHADLHARIAARGVLVSESPLAAAVHARDFPRRNRIISGLSLGVVVVEAEARSGSLITARYAAEQGREVFAIPGSPLDPRAAGPNSLIRDGARLVTGPDDVLDALRDSAGFTEPGPDLFSRDPEPLSLDASIPAQIASLLSPVPVSIEDIARDTGLPWRTVAAAIVELELSGRAVTLQGGRVASPV